MERIENSGECEGDVNDKIGCVGKDEKAGVRKKSEDKHMGFTL